MQMLAHIISFDWFKLERIQHSIISPSKYCTYNIWSFIDTLKYLKEMNYYIKMEEGKFKACNDRDTHRPSVSKYPVDKVPLTQFKLDRFGEYSKSCVDCSNYRNKCDSKAVEKHKKLVKETNEKYDSENLPFRYCSNKSHKNQGSKHLIDKVPLELFKNEKSIEPFRKCLDCRKYRMESYHRRDKKLKDFAEKVRTESAISGETVGFCTEDCHDIYGSPFAASKVPIQLFRKVPDNPKSDLFPTCKHCRDFHAEDQRKRAARKHTAAEEKGVLCCITCNKEKNIDKMAINIDGDIAAKCQDCKVKEKYFAARVRDNFNKLRVEYITKYQSSCYLCNNIYLSNRKNNKATEFTTYLRDNIRYVKYKDVEYTSANFIKIFNNLLELIILDFDHLTEEEQREREMLLPNEIFVPKKCNVSSCASEAAMRLEAKKCQLVCARCHMEETIRREKGISYNSPTKKEKIDFTNKLKSFGCTNCHYRNEDLPRFFDFDHIDPSAKVMGISQMISDNSYTMEDLKAEIDKCRILCRHCHKIHTKNQHKEGIIVNKLKKNI